MARFLVLCFILVLVVSLLAMANGSDTSESNVPKIGNDSEDHQHKRVGPDLANPPSKSSESAKDESETEKEEKTEHHEVAEAPGNRKMGKHHHSSDESIAGGGVIIGGLATAIFAAVFCYIRVTRRRDTTSTETRV